MADLVSMKYTPEEKKDQEKGSLCCPEYEGEQYPWGLSLNLDGVSMKKLGLTALAAGQELSLVAKVRVTASSSYSREGKPDETSATLQITDMVVEPPSARPSLYDSE